MVKRLLILGGTAEARKLAGMVVESLAGEVEAVTSLVERLGPMPELPGQIRTGPIEDIQALVDYLRQEAFDMVIDATHPFAEIISANAYAACIRTEVPRLMLIRPPWRLTPASRWVEVNDMAGAAKILPRLARRAFLTIGPGDIEAFSGVTGVWFLVRLVRQPEAPLPLADYSLVTGHPPLNLAAERQLLTEHRIDTLVCRQSGGKATEAKIIAAAEEGVRVVLIQRPILEPGEIAETAEEALNWLQGRF